MSTLPRIFPCSSPQAGSSPHRAGRSRRRDGTAPGSSPINKPPVPRALRCLVACPAACPQVSLRDAPTCPTARRRPAAARPSASRRPSLSAGRIVSRHSRLRRRRPPAETCASAWMLSLRRQSSASASWTSGSAEWTAWLPNPPVAPTSVRPTGIPCPCPFAEVNRLSGPPRLPTCSSQSHAIPIDALSGR